MFVSDYDKILHERIHAEMQNQDPTGILNNPRLGIFDYLLPVTGPLRGHGADIGCGSGYASIFLTKKFPTITAMDAIEQSELAVDELIPKNVKHWETPVVKAILGSFQSLPTNKYDFVLALGAIHHTPDLDKTAQSIFSALKPNGFLIAQEPSMPDFTSHAQYERKYSLIESKHGLKGRNGDRLDRFFRECEYKAAIIKAGFDLVVWDDWHPNKKHISGEQQFRHLAALANKGSLNEMMIATLDVQPKVIVAKKTNCTKIYNLPIEVSK